MSTAQPEGDLQEIDALIGNRIRVRRLALKMDQETLGRAVGLTAQEVKDHESGVIRVRASRLSAMAEALDVPILFFFKDLELSRNREPCGAELQNDRA